MRLCRYILSILLLVAAICVYSQEQEISFDEISRLSFDDQLIIYADKGDTASAQKLISRGANVNAATFEGVTPIMFAAQNGDTGMIRLLLRNGARVDSKPFNGYAALISAVRSGFIGTAEFLIRNGADINLADDDGTTPLMHAIAVDSFYLPDMLLYYDANVDHKNKQGTDALMVASRLGRIEIAVRLLEAGANVNAVDAQGNTPLHYAILGGNTDLMDLLILNGASIETVNSTGYTPLSAATAVNNFAAARLLVSYGADVNSRINKSMNPLTLALNNKNDSLASMLLNHNAHVVKRPYFGQYTFGTRFAFNEDDSQFGLSFGMSDDKYNLMPALGFGFRPKAVQILDDSDPLVIYQFWERRQFISLSLDKAFFLHSGNSAFKSSAFAGIGGVLTFGSYKGSNKNPETRVLFNPRLGWVGEYEFVRVKLSYEFMNLNLEDFDQGWINISLEFLFNRKKNNLNIPSMKWF